MPRKITLLVLVAALVALPACQMNARLSGTVIGAASGALIGGLATSSALGVLAGGVAGGVAGYLVGDYLADQRERCQSPCDPCPPACPPECPPPSPCVAEVPAQPIAAESMALVERGRQAATTPEAVYWYEQALHVDPQNAEAWNQLGLCRMAAGDRVAGRAAFQRALALDPGHVRAQKNLVWAGGR